MTFSYCDEAIALLVDNTISIPHHFPIIRRSQRLGGLICTESEHEGTTQSLGVQNNRNVGIFTNLHCNKNTVFSQPPRPHA